MSELELAKALFNKKSLAETNTDSISIITGTAVSDSKDGMVDIIIDNSEVVEAETEPYLDSEGNEIDVSDPNVKDILISTGQITPQDPTVVTLETSPKVYEGDTVTILCSGGKSKNMQIIGNIANGDVATEATKNAQETANLGYEVASTIGTPLFTEEINDIDATVTIEGIQDIKVVEIFFGFSGMQSILHKTANGNLSVGSIRIPLDWDNDALYDEETDAFKQGFIIPFWNMPKVGTVELCAREGLLLYSRYGTVDVNILEGTTESWGYEFQVHLYVDNESLITVKEGDKAYSVDASIETARNSYLSITKVMGWA